MKTQGYSLEEQRYELAADLMNQSRQTATFKANGEKSVDFKVANVRRFAVSEKRLRKAKIRAFEASDVVTRVDVVDREIEARKQSLQGFPAQNNTSASEENNDDNPEAFLQ